MLAGVGWGAWHTQVVLHGNLSFPENLQVLIQASPEPSPLPSSDHSWAPSLRLGCPYAFSLWGEPSVEGWRERERPQGNWAEMKTSINPQISYPVPSQPPKPQSLLHQRGGQDMPLSTRRLHPNPRIGG